MSEHISVQQLLNTKIRSMSKSSIGLVQRSNRTTFLADQHWFSVKKGSFLARKN
jgi:hypothetical protein